ncbi:MAG TPA: hypothetical protein VF607_11910 [Verrucomicrobiae bacterium]
MKTVNNFLPALALCLVLAGCHDKAPQSAAPPEKADAKADNDADSKAGIVLDADAQARLGLKLAVPATAEWQPQLPATGRVADPLAFLGAVTDLATARAAAAASASELERTRKLAEQNNASTRNLEAATAAATRDTLALKAAQLKFSQDWGARLAAAADLADFGAQLQRGDCALVKVFLPAGTFPSPLPASACLEPAGQANSLPVTGEWVDDLRIDPGTQVQTLLYLVKQTLPPNLAVSVQLPTAGKSRPGVTIPWDAVVRHEGKGWVYVQSGTNQFTRCEIPLDALTPDGWFVPAGVTTSNAIVTVGAGSVLSAELSHGDFGTGARD